MIRTLLTGICVLLALGACKGSRADQSASRAAAKRAPYDMAPLLTALRDGVASELPRQLGVKRLTDLPFYDISLRLRPAQARLEGRYTLHFKNTTGRTLRSIPLLLHPNTPRELGAKGASAELKLTGARSVAGPGVAKVRARRPTLGEIVLGEPLHPHRRITLEVTFVGTLRRLAPGSNDIFGQALSSMGLGGAGMGPSDYGLLAVGDGLFTMASAFPMVPPFHRGRFDTSPPTKFGDLSYNAPCHFRVAVTVPAGFSVVTNLRDAPPETGPKTDGVVVHRAAGAANRDLVLVAGRGLVRATRKLGDVTISSVSLPRDVAGGALVLETAVRSLELFQKRFGPYPYTELDVAEATLVGGAGGVEFPGMVLVAGMLYRKPSKSDNPLAQLLKMAGGLGSLLGGGLGAPGSAGAAGSPGGDGTIRRPPANAAAGAFGMMDSMVAQMAAFTTAHEVAHQYFAGLVGSDCRHEPALDEPLAQYAAGELAREALGEAAGARVMDMNAKMNYGIYRLIGGKDLPVARPVSRFPNPLAYAAIVYGKAPYFYVALEEKLGEAKMHRALLETVTRHRFQLVTLDRWVRSLEEAAGGPGTGVRKLARRWFHGTHGDQDLGVSESGDEVLEALLGKAALGELKQSLGLLGMSPRGLFRMLLGNMTQ